MKQFIAVALSLFAAAVSGRPRYLMVDLDDVDFVGEQARLPILPMSALTPHRRFARDLDDQEIEASSDVVFRPQALPVVQRAEVPTQAGIADSFIGAIEGAGISLAEDSLASGSSAYASPPQGSDYVDYGAYTGKHGAFGWYSDHPVLLFGHHH